MKEENEAGASCSLSYLLSHLRIRIQLDNLNFKESRAYILTFKDGISVLC